MKTTPTTTTVSNKTLNTSSIVKTPHSATVKVTMISVVKTTTPGNTSLAIATTSMLNANTKPTPATLIAVSNIISKKPSLTSSSNNAMTKNSVKSISSILATSIKSPPLLSGNPTDSVKSVPTAKAMLLKTLNTHASNSKQNVGVVVSKASISTPTLVRRNSIDKTPSTKPPADTIKKFPYAKLVGVKPSFVTSPLNTPNKNTGTSNYKSPEGRAQVATIVTPPTHPQQKLQQHKHQQQVVVAKETVSCSPSLKNTRTTITVVSSPNSSTNFTVIQKQKTQSVASANSSSDSLLSSSKVGNMTKSHTSPKNSPINYTSPNTLYASSSAYLDNRLSDVSKPQQTHSATHVTSPSRTFKPWEDSTTPVRSSYGKSSVATIPQSTTTTGMSSQKNSFSVSQLSASAQSFLMKTPQREDTRTLFQTTPKISPYAVTPTLVQKSPSKSLELDNTPAQLSKQIKRKSLQDEDEFTKNKRKFMSHQSPLSTTQSPNERQWSPSQNEHVHIPRSSSSTASRTVISHSSATSIVSNHSIKSQLNNWPSPRLGNNALTSPEKMQHLSHRSFSHGVQNQTSPVVQHHNYPSACTAVGAGEVFHHSQHHQEDQARGTLVQQQQQQQQRQRLSHYQHAQNHQHHHHHHQTNGTSSFDHR